MKHKLGLTLGLAALLVACQPAADTGAPVSTPDTKPAALAPSLDNIEVDMRFLASDELEGREAGTPGYDAAAEYVAARMAELGVMPAGDNDSYFQTVPLRRSHRAPDQLSLEIGDT